MKLQYDGTVVCNKCEDNRLRLGVSSSHSQSFTCSKWYGWVWDDAWFSIKLKIEGNGCPSCHIVALRHCEALAILLWKLRTAPVWDYAKRFDKK